MKKTQYPRKILLVSSGLTPQVVTETIYALAVKPDDPWIPTEVHLVTTRQGKEIVRHALLNPEHGHFHALINEYHLPKIVFSMKNVHVIRNEKGNLLNDICSEADNQGCADTMVNIVREVTSDPKSAVHVSIAGGRKTMGYYLGYALSLYGREQDKLSHVLVNQPYESHPDFYYPTLKSRLIQGRGERARVYDACEAKISLAEIPFVRLRDGLPLSLQKGKSSFSLTVKSAQNALSSSELIIDLKRRLLSISGEIITDMAPAELAFYSWMARRCLEGKDTVRPGEANLSEEFLREYKAVVGELSGDYDIASTSLQNGMVKEDFDYRKSRVNSILEACLPIQLYERYRIASIGKRPNTRYGLQIEVDCIHYKRIQCKRITVEQTL